MIRTDLFRLGEIDGLDDLPSRLFEKPPVFELSAIDDRSETSAADSVQLRIKRIKRFRAEAHGARERKTFATHELIAGVKGLNDEIKRLHSGLTRLDRRVNRVRVKRGMGEQKAIADCVRMKDKLKTIYDELNRMLETLTLMNANGICRCECPPGATGAAGQATLAATDLPLEATTFRLDDTGGAVQSGETTKRSPSIVRTGDESRNAADHENAESAGRQMMTGKTTADTATVTAPPEVTVTTAETKEDMSPAMSNAVTEFVRFNSNGYDDDDNGQTVEPSIVTTGTPPASTTADSNKTTGADYDETTDEHSTVKSTTDNGNVSETTTETPVSGNDHGDTDDTVPPRDRQLTTGNYNGPEFTTNSDTHTGDVQTPFVGSTTENISEFTTTEPATGRKYDNGTSVLNAATALPVTTANYKNIKEPPVADTSNVKGITLAGNPDGSENEKYIYERENASAVRPTAIGTQPVWFPICFYAAPCAQNAPDTRQLSRNENQNPIRYSAQSLKTHKKYPPVADATTIIQNSYPIVSYCPVGVVCSNYDYATASNTTAMLHCTLRPSFYKTADTVPHQAARDGYERADANDSAAVQSERPRDSDEILTGKKIPVSGRSG